MKLLNLKVFDTRSIDDAFNILNVLNMLNVLLKMSDIFTVFNKMQIDSLLLETIIMKIEKSNLKQ